MSVSTSTNFARLMGPVCIALLGEPPEKHHAGLEWRYGTRGSLSIRIDKGTFYDNEAGISGGTLQLIEHHSGMDKARSLAWMCDKKLIEELPQPTTKSKPQIVATYDYTNADGELLFQVVRFDPKDFRQRAPDGNGGWDWKTQGVQRVLYRLPEVMAAVAAGRTIYIVEGEKAVHAIEALGLVGTCSPGGAGKWRREYGGPLAGADVVILPDNDPQATDPDGAPRQHPDGRPVLPGQDHATDVTKHLRGIAGKVRVVPLPGLPIKGDVADWIAAGGTAAELEDIAAGVTAFATTSKPKPAPVPIASLNGHDLTEDGIALAFAAAHQDTLRYDHTRGAWFQWTGKAWRQDETKIAFSWSRRICRQLAKAAGVEDSKLTSLAKAATAAAVERFAQSDPALAVTSTIWDRDTFLLGTPGGTMDLRTGYLRDPIPEDHITKLTAVKPSVMPECPQWLAFLDQVTANDPQLIRFLKQWCGYCLTGDTREHALLFAHGPGGNGKGVFLNTVSGIMGDYARNAAMDTFVASASDKHPTDLAMLRGARLVTASETEEGRAWAEARIKAMTGGDTITARFMRQDFFEYTPQFKLTIIGNHKPVLKNVDDAARRRFNVIPFLYKPPAKDLQLETKLRAEWPGILRWMIEGCLDWLKNGLVRPEVVLAATAEYFSEQDTVHQWVEELCTVGKGQYDTLAILFKSWSEYALANGEKPGTTKWFSQTLARLGCEAVKNTPGNHGKRGFTGIGVNLPKAPAKGQQDDVDDRPDYDGQ